MKKFLALLLALTMALRLAACGDNSNQPAGSSAASMMRKMSMSVRM